MICFYTLTGDKVLFCAHRGLMSHWVKSDWNHYY